MNASFFDHSNASPKAAMQIIVFHHTHLHVATPGTQSSNEKSGQFQGLIRHLAVGRASRIAFMFVIFYSTQQCATTPIQRPSVTGPHTKGLARHGLGVK